MQLPHPIAEAPRDGRTLMVGDDDGWIAVAYWTGDFWAYGHKGEGGAVQLDFEPTRYHAPTPE